MSSDQLEATKLNAHPAARDAVSPKGRLAHNATWMFAGQVFNLFLQAAYFVLLARLLGVSQYGLFAGAFALVNTLTPYSALGSAMLVLRYVSVNHSVATKYWGNALLTTSIFTSIAVSAALVLRGYTHTFGSIWMVVVLLVSNCLFSQLTMLGSSVVFAFGKARLSAAMGVASNGIRLVVLGIMKLTLDHATALQWSIAVLVASFIAASLVYRAVYKQIGPAVLEPGLLKQRFVEGLGFSFAGTTEAVNNDLDKIMLLHQGLTVQNGFYTLAYRVIDFATSPIVALNSAVMQRHFVLNTSGLAAILKLVRKSLLVAIALGLLAACAIHVSAPLLPSIAGKSYVGAIAVLNVLCWLPLIRGVHQMCGSAVTGLGHQRWRTFAQGTAALLNIGLNLLWIPRYGWRGAAWSTLASDSLIAVLNITILLVLSQIIPKDKPSLDAAIVECS